MAEQANLLPTEKQTAQERLNELVSREYRIQHKVGIRSIKGYEGPLPEFKTWIYSENTIRPFPDGFETMVTPTNGLLYDDGRKYVVDFYILSQ